MNREVPTQDQLPPRWQKAIQLGWGLFTLLVLTFFFFEVSFSYKELLKPSIELQNNLAQLGMSVQTHALYLTGLRVAFMLVHLMIAIMIVVKRPNERITIFVALTLVFMGITFWPPANRIATNIDIWQFLRSVAQFLSTIFLIIFFLIFPDGHFTPRWSSFYVVAVLPLLAAEYFFPSSLLNPQNWNVLFSTALSLCTLAILVYVPVHRYR
ncbi:MAG TPA: hypothetical protein PKE23_10655, partial [Anaerolineales bacterium]|nr:hypothetical protein [Anaerolineales bacterium]